MIVCYGGKYEEEKGRKREKEKGRRGEEEKGGENGSSLFYFYVIYNDCEKKATVI